MTDAAGHAGRLEVVVKGGGVHCAERAILGELLRAPVGAQVGIDRHELDAVSRGACEDDRAAPAERPDLDDAPTGGHGRGAVVQAVRLLLGQPALDPGGEDTHAARRAPAPAPGAEPERQHADGRHELQAEDDRRERQRARVARG